MECRKRHGRAARSIAPDRPAQTFARTYAIERPQETWVNLGNIRRDMGRSRRHRHSACPGLPGPPPAPGYGILTAGNGGWTRPWSFSLFSSRISIFQLLSVNMPATTKERGLEDLPGASAMAAQPIAGLFGTQ